MNALRDFNPQHKCSINEQNVSMSAEKETLISCSCKDEISEIKPRASSSE